MEPILPVKRPLLQAAIFEALEEFNLKSQALNSVSIPAAQQNNTSAEPEPLCSRCTEPGPDDCVVAFRTTDDLAVNTDVNNSEAAKLEALRLEWDRMDVDKPMKPACVLYVYLFVLSLIFSEISITVYFKFWICSAEI